MPRIYQRFLVSRHVQSRFSVIICRSLLDVFLHYNRNQPPYTSARKSTIPMLAASSTLQYGIIQALTRGMTFYTAHHVAALNPSSKVQDPGGHKYHPAFLYCHTIIPFIYVQFQHSTQISQFQTCQVSCSANTTICIPIYSFHPQRHSEAPTQMSSAT